MAYAFRAFNEAEYQRFDLKGKSTAQELFESQSFTFRPAQNCEEAFSDHDLIGYNPTGKQIRIEAEVHRTLERMLSNDWTARVLKRKQERSKADFFAYSNQASDLAIIIPRSEIERNALDASNIETAETNQGPQTFVHIYPDQFRIYHKRKGDWKEIAFYSRTLN